VYDSKADCAGAGTENKTLEASFTQIRDLGQIFNVEERAEALIAQMQATLDDVAARVAGRPTPSIAILDYIDDKGVPSFYAAGLYTDLINRAGGANVFADQAEQYVAISPEVVASRPVDVLAVMQWEGTISAEEKAEYYFRTYPEAPASQNRRYVVLTNMDLNAGSGNADAVAKMARALHPDAFASNTSYPVTVENCGQQLTIERPPERVIVSWGGQAAYLLALGLGDRIVGMYYRFPDEENRLVPPELKEGYLAIPVIGGSDGTPPSREVPIALNPDFFYSDSPSDFADSRATREDFATVGAAVFSSVYGCTAPDQQTIPQMFDEIRTLGVIFNKQAEAEALVSRLSSELAAVEVRVAGRTPVNALLLEGSTETLYVAGNGLVTDVFARAGGVNIFDGASYDTPPSREVLAASAPDVVVLWDNSTDELLPVTELVFANAPAATNDRIVPVRYIGGIGLRVPEFAEALARLFHPEAFE
jgi:iron complex transport system substrate-binding protein